MTETATQSYLTQEAFDRLKDATHMILNAPMGSGKSWEMCLLSSHKMAADPKTKDWWKITEPQQKPLDTRREGEWWASMEEVFHVD